MIVRYSTKFLKDVKRLRKTYKKIAQDLQEIENLLVSNEIKGQLLQGLSELKIFKIRYKNSSIKSGKSGGFRIIYYQVDDNNIIMLTIYSKTQSSNISKNEILEIINN